MRRETLKKRIALLLSCMMVFSLFGTNLAFAEDLAGTSESAGVQQINSADDFPTEIAAGETYELTADITLNGDQQISMLAGVLDGKGHTITLSGKALADTIAETGIVQNLGVSGNLPTDYTAAYAMHFKGTIQTCFSTVATTGWTEISGFAADIQGGTIQNSWYSGNAGFGAAFVYNGGEGTLKNLVYQISGFGGAYAGTNALVINNVQKIGDEAANWSDAVKVLNTDRPYTGYKWEMGAEEYPVLVKDAGTEEPEAADKTVLNSAIAAAENKVETDYTEDSWQALQAALTSARETASKEDVSQREVNEAASALIQALSALVKIKLVKPVKMPDDAIKISTVSDLEAIGTGAGKYYVLENDITIKQSDWYFAFDEFQGVFDGQGYSIIFEKSGSLFGSVGTDGVVQNVHFTGTVSSNGPLGQTIAGSVLNCYSDTAEGNSAGFANKLDGGVLANCYSISTAKNGAIVNLYGEGADGNTYTGTLYNTYWQSGLTVPQFAAEDLKNGSGAKTKVEMQTSEFVSLLNQNRGDYGKSWGLSEDSGYPYFGEDQTKPLPVEENKYAVVFTETNKESIEVGEQLLKVFPGVSGTFSLKDFPETGEVEWSLQDVKPEGAMTLSDGNTLRAVSEGAGVVVASVKKEDGTSEPVAAVKVMVSTRTLTELRLLIDGQDVTNDAYTVQGSEWKRIEVQGKYEGLDDFQTLASNEFSIEADPSVVYNLPPSREFYFKEPTTKPIKVSYKANPAITATVHVTSAYVPVVSVEQTIGESIEIHGINANSYSRKAYLPYKLGFHIQPENASNKDNFKITSSDPDVAEYLPTMVVGYVPYKAGTTTFTMELQDTDPATGKVNTVSSSKTVTFRYLNPLTKIEVPESMTMENYTTAPLDIKFTGSRSGEGYNVSDTEMHWTYDKEGIVEISAKPQSGQPFSWLKRFLEGADPSDPDYGNAVSTPLYDVRALKEGTVTATGTPVDQTNDVSPVQITITVSGGAAPTVDISALVTKGLKVSSDYLKNSSQSGLSYDREWELFTMVRAGEEISESLKTAYYQAVLPVIKEWKETQKPTDIERVALAMSSIGKDITNLDGVNLAAMIYNHQNLDSGSNELAYGLIALDARMTEIPGEAKWSREAMIEALLQYQNQDGGFGLDAEAVSSGIDTTAYVLQALAPYQDRADVKSAIDKGLAYLKKNISASHGYANAEATAQVLLALTSLSIDPLDETQGFGTAYSNLVTNLMEYCAADESGFSHAAGGVVSSMATIQAAQALDAYQRFTERKTSYWDLRDIKAETTIVTQEVQAETEGNTAKAELSDSAVEEGITGDVDEIVIDIKGTESAEKVDLALSKETLGKIQQSGGSLILSFEGISVEFNSAVQKKIADTAGDKFHIVITKENALTEAQLALLGKGAVGYKVEILSETGEPVITDFGNETIRITVPYEQQMNHPTAISLDKNNMLKKLGGLVVTSSFSFETFLLQTFAVISEAAADRIIKEQNTGGETQSITVTFSLLGDKLHNSDEDHEIHTLQSGNLQTWIGSKSVTVSAGATVKDVLTEALKGTGYTVTYRFGGTYVSAITTPGGLKVEEFSNGKNSGWMYTLNGTHPELGVSEQSVKNNDVIVFHYTDNHTSEEGAGNWNPPAGDPENPGDTDIDDPNTPLDPGTEAVKSMVSSMKLTARSARTSKKNVKVTVKADKAAAESIEDLKEMGYTVKYRYYRSTEKGSGYKAMLTKKAAVYTNTYGKNGSMYYYKVQLRVYDKDGKLVAKTALKQCKYANRIWKKK